MVQIAPGQPSMEGSQVQTGSGGIQSAQIAYKIIGITANDAASATDQAVQAAGVPQIGQPFPGGAAGPSTQAVVIGHIYKGLSADMGTLTVLYDRPSFDTVAPIRNTWFATYDSTLSQFNVETTPAHKPCELNFTDPDDSERKIYYPASLSVMTPLERINLLGYFNRAPSDTVRKSVNKVNSAAWNGYDRGFWLCSGVNVQAIQHSGSKPILWRASAEFITKQVESWSTYSVVYDTMLGRKVKPPANEWSDIRSLEYVARSWRTSKSGAIGRLDWFSAENFDSVFNPLQA